MDICLLTLERNKSRLMRYYIWANVAPTDTQVWVTTEGHAKYPDGKPMNSRKYLGEFHKVRERAARRLLELVTQRIKSGYKVVKIDPSIQTVLAPVPSVSQIGASMT